MSEKLNRLAVAYLRRTMFPALPADIQALIPLVSDPLAAGDVQVPNIVIGAYPEYGAGAALPMITVDSYGSAEGILKVYRHGTLDIDIWVGGGQTPNIHDRQIVSILYEYIFRVMHNGNFSGQNLEIARCYEIERSPILFEPQNKIYHLKNAYRVEALSQVWY